MSDADLAALVQAVTEAEQMTSAEIRVHLDHRCQGDALARAVKLFERLDMHRTRLRNGVLIYVAVEDRKLAVIGDTGIHEHVGETFWQRLVAATLDHLRQARPRDGLVAAVRDVGAVLRVHFPRDPEDRNELSDEVSLT
jgi:uncharacterized membrane protein